MPTSTQNIVFSAKIEGTSQVINGINQINLAMTGLSSNITRMGGSASAAGNILQTAFGYAGGRAIVSGLESIARGLGTIATSARESISDFQRLGGVINVAAAREMQENTAIKERIKTGTALGVLNKQQLTQWKNLTESWRPSSLAMMQVDLQQAQAKLNDTYLRQARAKGPSKDSYDVAISESQQRIKTLQGKIAEDQTTYNQLLVAQGPRAITEEVTKQTMALDQALQASSGVVDQYLQRIQAQVLHAPVAQQTMAKMFQTLAGYGAGRGAPLGVVETSYQLAQGMSNFGIASGRTNEQLFDMAMAMGQVQSKGKLMAEEMNRQFANAGLTMSDVLKAFDMAYPKFGLTADNFQSWMKEGKITASLFIEAMRQYFAQWDAGAQRMKTTWAYIPQMLQNIRDTIVRIGFTPLFEQLKKPLAAFIDLFDPEKNPAALEGIKAMGDSIGKFIAPAMDYLAGPAMQKMSQFLQGWRLGGNLTSGIANSLGLGIRTGLWQWDLGALLQEIWTRRVIPKVNDLGGQIARALYSSTGNPLESKFAVWLDSTTDNVKTLLDSWTTEIERQNKIEPIQIEVSYTLVKKTYGKTAADWAAENPEVAQPVLSWAELVRPIAEPLTAVSSYVTKFLLETIPSTVAILVDNIITPTFRLVMSKLTSFSNIITPFVFETIPGMVGWALQSVIDSAISPAAQTVAQFFTVDIPQWTVNGFNSVVETVSTKATQMAQALTDNFRAMIPDWLRPILGIPTGGVSLSAIGPNEPVTILKGGGAEPRVPNNYSSILGLPKGPGTLASPVSPNAILPYKPTIKGFLRDRFYQAFGGYRSERFGAPEYSPTTTPRFEPPTLGGFGYNLGSLLGTPATSPMATVPESIDQVAAPIAQMTTQLENIVAILGLQGPQAAEIFKSAAIDAATSTTTQMAAAQSILQQMTTTGYPQLAQVAAAWQQAQMEGLTNLAGVLQFLFQLMMSMGLGTGGALGGLGLGTNPYGDLSGGGGGGAVDAHARHGHFRTSSGRYENPFTSGFDLSYLTAEQLATATANYNNQQLAEGKPLVSAANPTGEQQTEYVRGTANSTDLLTRQLPILIQATWSLPEAIAAALADTDSGGKGGSQKDKGYQGIYGSNISRDYFTSNIKGYARGADFLTPSGSSNDRYPFMALLSGNERVKIMPNGRDSTGVVMVSKSVNIGDVNINSGMDLAMFRTMLTRALAT